MLEEAVRDIHQGNKKKIDFIVDGIIIPALCQTFSILSCPPMEEGIPPVPATRRPLEGRAIALILVSWPD
jgi:hypothetical protein